MTRAHLGAAITGVIPSSQRERDRHELEYLAGLLDSGLPLATIEDERHNFARMLRRYLADNYPKARRGRSTKAAFHRAIAEAYVLLHDCLRDRLAENKIAAHCRKHGVTLEAQTVGRIARGKLGKEARASIAAALAEGRMTYTRESMVRAYLADALRRAAKP